MGASWTGQLISLIVAVGFGAVAGFPALLFLRKARPLERALTDFFAVISLTVIYVLSVEYGSDGQIKFYTVLGFLAGLVTVLFVFKKIKSRLVIKSIPLLRRKRAKKSEK